MGPEDLAFWGALVKKTVGMWAVCRPEDNLRCPLGTLSTLFLPQGLSLASVGCRDPDSTSPGLDCKCATPNLSYVGPEVRTQVLVLVRQVLY